MASRSEQINEETFEKARDAFKSNCEAEKEELAARVRQLEHEALSKAFYAADSTHQQASLAQGRARANLLIPVEPFRKRNEAALITALVNYIDLTAKVERLRAEKDAAYAAVANHANG